MRSCYLLNSLYFFKDRPDLNNKKVCGSPHHQPRLMSGADTCPEHCTTKLSQHLNRNNLEIDPKTGNFTIKDPSDALKVS